MPLRRTSAAAASSITAAPEQESAPAVVYIKTQQGRDNTGDMSSSSSSTSEPASDCDSCRSNHQNEQGKSSTSAGRCSNLVVRTQRESLDTTYESSGNSPSVRFSTITIKEYARRMGDNPGCKTGVSLTIEWNVQYEVSLTLDEYEETRPARRERGELNIPADVRMQMVREAGFARSEILQYVKAANIARQQRMRTNETLKLAPAQEFTERLVRGILSKSLFRKQKKQEKELLQQHREKDQQLWIRNASSPLKTRVKRRSTSSTVSTTADEAATLASTACASEYDEESYSAKMKASSEEEDASEQPEEVEASDNDSPKVAKAVLDLDFCPEETTTFTTTPVEC